MKKKRDRARRRDEMAFDGQGRPLPLGPDEVQGMTRRALDSPDGELIAVLLRHKGNLLLQIMGPPSRETLTDLQHALEMVIKGYGNILRGH